MDNNIYNYEFMYIPLFYGGKKRKQPEEANSGMDMRQLLEEYRLFLGVQFRKHNTQVHYYSSAEKFTRYIKDLNKEEIQRYVIHLNQTQKPNAVVSNIVGLNRFLEYLKRPDLRVSTPNWQPITRDIIRREQIIQIIDYAKEHCMFMDYLILLMVRDLDCRNHEIILTRWDWIHGDKILFKDCKTGDTTGLLTKELQEALAHWKTITPYPGQPNIFVIPYGPFKGRQMSRTGWYIRSLINRVSLEVIGRRLNPQDLRASVITAEYTAYVNPKIIQLKARHRSEKTTMRYNHVDEEIVAEYIGKGTIFSNNTEPVLKAKPEIATHNKTKRGCINSFSEPRDTLNTEEEDNTTFSFSYSFFDTHASFTSPCTNMRTKTGYSSYAFFFLPNKAFFPEKKEQTPRCPHQVPPSCFHRGSIPRDGVTQCTDSNQVCVSGSSPDTGINQSIGEKQA